MPGDFYPRELNGMTMVLSAMDLVKSKGFSAVLKEPNDCDGVSPPALDALQAMRAHWKVHYVNVRVI